MAVLAMEIWLKQKELVSATQQAPHARQGSAAASKKVIAETMIAPAPPSHLHVLCFMILCVTVMAQLITTNVWLRSMELRLRQKELALALPPAHPATEMSIAGSWKEIAETVMVLALPSQATAPGCAIPHADVTA